MNTVVLWWAVTATLLAVLFAVAGTRLFNRVHELTASRAEAHQSMYVQAAETERLAVALQDGCRLLRQQLESQDMGSGWEAVQDFLTEFEA